MTRKPIIRRARQLRQAENVPEDVAWQALRTLRAYGFAVRRQHPIGPYIADFAIQKAMLVIEVDGGIHHQEDVQLRDGERQRDIEARGWRILRLSTEEAMSADHVMRAVTEALGI